MGSIRQGARSFGLEAVKQLQQQNPLNKPVAAVIRNGLLLHHVCKPLANRVRHRETVLVMRLVNTPGKVTEFPELDQAKALDLGSVVLANLIIWTISTVAAIFSFYSFVVFVRNVKDGQNLEKNVQYQDDLRRIDAKLSQAQQMNVQLVAKVAQLESESCQLCKKIEVLEETVSQSVKTNNSSTE